MEDEMEQRNNQLLRQLSHLGYSFFEIQRIIQNAAGSDDTASLEKYVMLGSDYLALYSK